jgi:hypothetical protein
MTMNRLATEDVEDIFVLHGPVTYTGDQPTLSAGRSHDVLLDDDALLLLHRAPQATERRCRP